MRRWPNAVSASARTRSSTMTCPRARSSHSTRSRPSRSRRIRSSSSACPRARRRRKTPRTTRRTRRRTTSPTMTRRTATRTRRTDRAVVEGTSCCLRATAVWLSVTNQEAGATAFDCGGPGLLMCPSDSALTDAEPFDSSASLPTREVLSDLEGHFERLVVVESRVEEGLVATPQTFVIDLRGPAHNLGDVVTGALDVQAAGDGARIAVEGQLVRRFVVESRVDEGLVATPQTFVIDLRGPAHNLGDVVTGELDVQAAGDGARIAVGVEEALDLGHDVFEPARLVAGVRGDRVSVHGIADPGHMRQPVADAVEQLGQGLTDLAGAHAGDEGESTGFGVRIELLGQ